MKFDVNKLKEINDLDFEQVATWPFEVKSLVAMFVVILSLVAGYYFLVQDKLPLLEVAQEKELNLKQVYQGKYRIAVNLEAYQEQLEYVRLFASGDKNNPRFAEAEAEYQKKRNEYTTLKAQYVQIMPIMEDAHKAVSAHLKKGNYIKEELSAIKTEDKTLQQHIYAINILVFGNDFETAPEALEVFNKTLKQLNEMLDYSLNKEFNGREIVGDNPNDFNDRNYGNGNVKPRDDDESHGTHVAGIIAAERNNNKGMNGVANNVVIMPIRAVSNGDE